MKFFIAPMKQHNQEQIYFTKAPQSGSKTNYVSAN